MWEAKVWRSRPFAAAAMALAAALLLAPAVAQGEQCNEGSTICFETEATGQNPLIPPQTLKFKVDSQWTELQVILVGPETTTHLLEPGGLGGTSMWSADWHWVSPGEDPWVDGTYSMFVRATMPPFPEHDHHEDATFAVPVLAPVVGEGASIRRRGNRFVGRFGFTARRQLNAVAAFSVPGEPDAGVVSVKQTVVPAGQQTMTVRYPLKKLRGLDTCRSAWRGGNSCAIQVLGFATPEDIGNVSPGAAFANARAFSRVIQVRKPHRR